MYLPPFHSKNILLIIYSVTRYSSISLNTLPTIISTVIFPKIININIYINILNKTNYSYILSILSL